MDADYDADYIEPYDCNDPRNEPRPDSVVYQPIFEQLRTTTYHAVHMLRDTLIMSPYQNAVTHGLLEEVRKRVREDAAEQTMFAISGDMAAGTFELL